MLQNQDVGSPLHLMLCMGMPLNAVSMEEGKSIHVAECSKAALLKVQRDLDGRGIICAGEVS